MGEEGPIRRGGRGFNRQMLIPPRHDSARLRAESQILALKSGLNRRQVVSLKEDLWLIQTNIESHKPSRMIDAEIEHVTTKYRLSPEEFSRWANLVLREQGRI